MMKQKHILKRLDNLEKNTLNELVERMFLRSNDDNNLKQVASKKLEKLQILPFSKLRFSSKMYSDKNDWDLVKRLRAKFGADSILVIGNWSAPNVKHQEPTRNKALIRMLQK
ncbi:hypothetical protein, partial [Klebsiella pneumoniae]|uniref:hypothetical protein n=1 Tax=Klebsiella pneumoniae TaxID=573 RepID=UPI000FE0B172